MKKTYSYGPTTNAISASFQYCQSSSFFCRARFNANPAAGQNGVMVFTNQSISGNGTPYTSVWDFGDSSTSTASNPIHTYQTNGWKRVCLTISTTTCTDTYCDSIFVNSVVPTGILFGLVLGAGVNAAGIEVVLFDANTFASLDTTQTYPDTVSGGLMYFFGQVPVGNYLILAQPRYGTSAFNSMLPTYFGFPSTSTWSSASSVNITSGGSSTYYNIQAITYQNTLLSGSGSIAGSIQKGNWKLSSGVLGKARVYLLQNNLVQQITQTNSSGSYSFQNLPFGTYEIRLEWPGKSMSTTIVTLSAAQPSVNLGAIVLNVAQGTTAASQLSVYSNIQLYPQPAKGLVNIKMNRLKSGNCLVNVLDVSGRSLLYQKMNCSEGENTISLSLEAIPSGFYTVILTDQEGAQHSLKLVVE
jgi:PKD repeat protein